MNFAHTIFICHLKSIGCFLNKNLWRCLSISNKELQINDGIRDAQVRLINSDGSQVGVVSIAVAKKMATEQNLDLVKIAEKAVPPVCKIIDYGKYKFELAKKEKESRKNQHVVDIKEVRLSLNIDTNDVNTKVRHAEKFIKGKDKVKVSLRFKGREMGHPEIGYELMKKFADLCSEFADIERPAKLEGRNMLMFLAPKTKQKSGNSKNLNN